jgi:hypothetical protein
LDTGQALVLVWKEEKSKVAQFDVAVNLTWFYWNDGGSKTSIELSQKT